MCVCMFGSTVALARLENLHCGHVSLSETSSYEKDGGWLLLGLAATRPAELGLQ
jgi:hypothetical protein